MRLVLSLVLLLEYEQTRRYPALSYDLKNKLAALLSAELKILSIPSCDSRAFDGFQKLRLLLYDQSGSGYSSTFSVPRPK